VSTAASVGWALAGAVLVALAACELAGALDSQGQYVGAALLTFGVIASVALQGVGRHHPFPRLGPANLVTGFRAVLTALLAGAVVVPPTERGAWVLLALSAVAVGLDGVDGHFARRSGMSSAFGARFDMEVDALLILVLSVLVWRFGKAGVWVVASGLMRYAFVAAAWVWPWFDRALPSSRRRQTVCVIQIVGLICALGPPSAPPVSNVIAAASLAALTWSFWVDVRWLWDRRAA
jgi:phosphatidylglycerophosphate synthase